VRQAFVLPVDFLQSLPHTRSPFRRQRKNHNNCQESQRSSVP
jgi:hypothetical protein